MKYDYIYEKNTVGYEKDYELSFDGDCMSTILLKEENLVLKVNSNGEIALCNENDEVIDKREVKSEKYPDSKFGEVLVKTTDDEVVLSMLVLKYKDNYPHCDGEHDRWTAIRIDNIKVTFEIK